MATVSTRGFQLKYISLVTLVIQNSALVLVLRYSRTLPGPRYLASAAVVLSELTKCLISLYIYLKDEHSRGKITLSKVCHDIIGKNSDSSKIAVPAILYMIQNNLQYLAATHLDAATFQVTYQMKILTTAMFSVFLLNRSLSRLKWLALVLLTAGIALVQLPTSTPTIKMSASAPHLKTPSSSSSSSSLSDDSSEFGSFWSQFVGLGAVTAACVLSGLAGVYFEKVLKNSPASLWLRNIQLSLFSAVPGFFFGVMIMDGDIYQEHGFFYGFNGWTWAAIACQAIGGLIVAVVVKYADNILKGFATSISIILSCIASVWLFNFVITIPFFFGSGAVLYATYLYGLPDSSSSPPSILPVRRPEVSGYSQIDSQLKE